MRAETGAGRTPGWPHLNPENAIHIAREAEAKRLALMHFGAEVETGPLTIGRK